MMALDMKDGGASLAKPKASDEIANPAAKPKSKAGSQVATR
jgi:hypothetical protein